MNNLTPTQIIDKNGKRTTVHKNLNKEANARNFEAVNKVANRSLFMKTKNIINTVMYNGQAPNPRILERDVERVKMFFEDLSNPNFVYFGALSEHLAGELHSFSPSNELEAAKQIIAASGLEDVPMDTFDIPESSSYEDKDNEVENAIFGQSAETVGVNVPGISKRDTKRFYLSQIFNRRMESSGGDEGSFDTHYELEYMGASEYEFGAIPRAIGTLRDSEKLEYAEVPVTINGVNRTVYFVGQDIADAAAVLKSVDGSARQSGHHNSILGNNKIYSGFDDAFFGGGRRSANARTAWFALDDKPFFYTLDESRASDVTKLIHRNANKKQKVTKLDIDFRK